MDDLDRAILTLEARRWHYLAVKHETIRVELGLTSTAYYARLGALLDDPEAEACAPATVRRLRRLRERRRAARVQRVPQFDRVPPNAG